MAEHLSFFVALGVVIVFFAALALGRLAVIGVREAGVRETAADEVTWTKDGQRADEEEARGAAR